MSNSDMNQLDHITVIFKRNHSHLFVVTMTFLVMASLIEFVIDPVTEATWRHRNLSGLPLEHLFFAVFLLGSIWLLVVKTRGDILILSSKFIIDQSTGSRLDAFRWEDVDELLVKTGRRGWICFRAKPNSDLLKSLTARNKKWHWLRKFGLLVFRDAAGLFCFNYAVIQEEPAAKAASWAQSNGIKVTVLSASVEDKHRTKSAGGNG